MWSLGPMHVIALLVAVAAAASLCGSVASTLARRKRQRARRSFIVGFFCGFTTGVIVRRRWRDVGRLAVRALSSADLPSRLGHSPQRRGRLPSRLPLALLTARR
jgi:hypothetical protein